MFCAVRSFNMHEYNKIFNALPYVLSLSILLFSMFFFRFIGSMSYYGVMLHTDNLSGNILLNFFLLVVVEFPAKICDIVLLDRCGRKGLFVGLMILGGIANISTTIPPLLQCNGKYDRYFLHEIIKKC